MSFVVRCSLLVVRCLRIVCCSLFVVFFIVDRCLLAVVCCLLVAFVDLCL